MKSTSVVVLVPVLDRPRLIRPLLESLETSAVRERGEGWTVRALFIATPGDRRELLELERVGADHVIAPFAANARGQYARKINHGVEVTDETWMLLAADDLRFHPGWLRSAIDAHIQTGALVIGTNDLGNATVIRGDHATHSLVHRHYVAQGTVDTPGVLLHDGYDHNSVDVEFVETAKARHEFAFAADSHVEHLHRLWGKSQMDATYRKGLRNATADRRLMLSRRRLWGGAPRQPRGPKIHGRWP